MKRIIFIEINDVNKVHPKLIFIKIWYLFAIEIIDTQVARRGRQYHSQPTLQKRKIKVL